MVRYIIKRLIMVIPIMIGVTFFVFMILSLTPGDPAVIALGSDATEEQLELFREQNGLNAPIIVQYLNYMKAAVTGGSRYFLHNEAVGQRNDQCTCADHAYTGLQFNDSHGNYIFAAWCKDGR